MNKQHDMNIEITRGDAVKWSPRFCQIVTLNGKAIGYFRPAHWSNQYQLYDAADEAVKYTRKSVGYRDWVKEVEVTRIDEMVEKVKTVLLQGDMPDQAFIDKRQAERDAQKVADDAERAENNRIWLIKENAEELLEVLEVILDTAGAHGEHDFATRIADKAQAVINQAKGIK